jgi:hypothetical protein
VKPKRTYTRAAYTQPACTTVAALLATYRTIGTASMVLYDNGQAVNITIQRVHSILTGDALGTTEMRAVALDRQGSITARYMHTLARRLGLVATEAPLCQGMTWTVRGHLAINQE